MDGHSRWAQRRGVSLAEGHAAGTANLRQIVYLCCKWGIPAITCYALSAENIARRDPREVAVVMRLIQDALSAHLAELCQQGVRLVFAGDRSPLPLSLVAAIERAEDLTRFNGRMLLTVAVNYSGRTDIALAVRRIAAAVEREELRADQVDVTLLEGMLSTAPVLSAVGPPDLVVRTGGDQRLSNFLLWEVAYSELYFAPEPWPDFGEEALTRAMVDYAARSRRFGSR